ncbi:G/U mismatch-specific DNA glycosylase [Labedaea rhizosphaerae]|uniref:G/U mismatch-specific uracil-DNA glycosylase n=1 Tax=Labedaea rhizosphaerae TaxID=598644 RepID=A0A4R6RZR3_LABRH|nr:G/U mismatch-specific DNA glycosylase [Labedaea rhizosphaerae]TDP92127.1 G/U mismatch-specific uracil-DNA glycosylase [Labedaea rhizosphaerae]
MSPTRAELLAASDRLLPDVIAPGLDVLFCGINPGLYSAWSGHHFARPGNRFWPALHGSGFTPRLLHPSEQDVLPSLGLGITNVVPRASARADELTAAELTAGGVRLRSLVAEYRPRVLAVLGVTAFRDAFAARDAVVGRQPSSLGATVVWVLPNPSGLNAHYQLPALIQKFAELRASLGANG